MLDNEKIEIQDLSFIYENNSFIPEGRELLYGKGLLAGLQGDLVVAAHLLIPQLENSLRYILEQSGSITSGFNSETIQDEYMLSKVLAMPSLRDVLQEEIIFSLKCLLVERMGFNLRNELCHGLLGEKELLTPQVLYLWWLTLYLCLTPKLKA